MIAASIVGIGVCAYGMRDWEDARSLLRGEHPWQPAPLPKLDVPLLPAAERRRINPASRLAITAAVQAVAQLPEAGRWSLASVFATADGDGQVLASTLHALSEDALAMSPTLFHNSVFNASAGYWTIASQSRARSTTVSAGDGSFAAGMLEAAVELAAGGGPILLVAADMPFPDALASFEVNGEAFACALLLVPFDTSLSHSLGTVSASYQEGLGDCPGVAVDADVLAVFRGNPAARALPLLAAIARGERAAIALPYVDGSRVEIAFAP